VLEEVLVVDVHAFGWDMVVGHFISAVCSHEQFWDAGRGMERCEHLALIERAEHVGFLCIYGG
jgi:hypothetical protein